MFRTAPSAVTVQTPARGTVQYGGDGENAVGICPESLADTAVTPAAAVSAPKQRTSASVRRSICLPPELDQQPGSEDSYTSSGGLTRGSSGARGRAGSRSGS